MKFFKRTHLFCLGMVLCLPLIGGCQKGEIEQEEGTVLPLNKIPENADYAALPLVGTKWKLIGFANDKKREIKLSRPSEGNSYTLIFGEKSELSGYTSTNAAYGIYSVKKTHYQYPISLMLVRQTRSLMALIILSI